MQAKTVKNRILGDIKRRLLDEFHQNFKRKAFFDKRWQARKILGKKSMRGSLLLVSGRLRRSLKAKVLDSSIQFTSDTSYAVAHNEGLSAVVNIKAHNRRSKKGKSYSVKSHQRKIELPERRFIGDHPKVRAVIESSINEKMQEFSKQIGELLKPN